MGETPAAVTRDAARAERRARILRATGELVAKRGYNTVTVELIVKRAKVSYKTFYSFFPNKEACFLELFDEVIEGIQGEIDAALREHAEAPWPERVSIALGVLFGTFLADPLIARASVVEAPTVGPVIIERYERAMTALSPLLRLGRELSPDPASLPDTLEDTLGGGVLWSAYQRLIVGEASQMEALLPEAIEFVLRPYIGEQEAARWARQAPAPASAS